MNQPNQNDDRRVKAADIQCGDHIYSRANGAPVEVTHVQPFVRRGEDHVTIVTADGNADEYYASDHVVRVTNDELAAARERKARAEKIATFRSMVDWLEDHPEIPLPDRLDGQKSLYGPFSRQLAEVHRVAALLGQPVEERTNATGQAVAGVEVKFGGQFGASRYTVYASDDGVPEPLSAEKLDLASVEDVAPRGTDAAETAEAKPPGVEGHGHERGSNWRDEPTGRRHDPTPTIFLGPGETYEQWYAAYATRLDTEVPGWWDDDTAGMAPELAALARDRRHETYAQNELDHDRVPTVEGYEEQQARRGDGATR